MRFLFFILLLMPFFACNNKAEKPVATPVIAEKKAQKINYSINKGKEYFDKKQLELDLYLQPNQSIEVKWKYSEVGLNATRYGDRSKAFIGILSPKTTAKKAVYWYQNTEIQGLLEESYWSETLFIPLFHLYELKKGKQSIKLYFELKSEQGKTICQAELLLPIEMPVVCKTKLSIKELALNETGCAQIGDEEFLLNKTKTYPDLMFLLASDDHILYESEVFKNTCSIKKEINFDIYYYETDKKINLKVLDKDYGFNPSDDIALWELAVAELTGNTYRDIGAKPMQFYHVAKNPIGSCKIKGQYTGAVNK